MTSYPVIPAKAGIQSRQAPAQTALDPCFRRGDEWCPDQVKR
jgi:hypothetical protein